MKNRLMLFSLLLILAGCNSATETENVENVSTGEYETFGAVITNIDAVPVQQLPSLLEGKDSVNVKLTGVIDEVCQKKGCWMTVKVDENQTMMVRFLDYDFFVPENSGGKTTVIEGVAFAETLSVEELKHYAEDGGKSQEEIDAITAPEISLSFEATGVLIKK